MNQVSVEAVDIFSPGRISESDSCGADSDCGPGTWSSALVSDSVVVSSVPVVTNEWDCSFCCDCDVCRCAFGL